MVSKESHCSCTYPYSCPALCPCPCSTSASNLETCLLTLLSHPWPQWQAHPLASPTSVEIYHLWSLDANCCTSWRWTCLREPFLCLPWPLAHWHSDQKCTTHTIFPQRNVDHCEFNFANDCEVGFFFFFSSTISKNV